MIHQVEAVCEKGVLRPLEPLSLPESQRVRLTIATAESGRTQRDMKLLERVRADAAALKDVPTLEEIQQILSVIPGSLKEDFDREREDR